jgi:bacillithiol biosynthesis deacetylase BshB1
MKIKLDVIFFATHPDDAELCCGGTIAKLVKNGKKTGIIDLTRGELSTRGNLKTRILETEKASKVLSIHYRENMEFNDGNIENNFKNRLEIIKRLRHLKPKIIFLPFPYDRHPDHINASILIKEAAFYSGLEKILTSYNGKQQKAYRPCKNIYYLQTYTSEPTFIIDISKEFNTKMKAVACYSSQFHNPKSTESETFISDKKFIDFVEARAKFWGFKIGTEYGEPFFTEETIKLNANTLFDL